MLEPILKGLVEWLYQIMVDIMSYASGELIGVLSMDLSYFESTAPIISDIVKVFIALGWALLIGNLVFQLLKSMVSGIGFEAEDPKIIFLRTFVFAFLLLSSRQICDIGLSITSKVIDLLALPASIEVKTPDESMFALAADAKWLLVIIVGVVLMVQMVKLLFEIGERYVITSVLTFFAPLAFSMGGSRNTNDIFKGWVRMYCSMLVMMIMNIVFLKLIMSAMSRLAAGNVLVWLVFVVALTRVARKIDSHIGKIGLNPAQTGDGIGSRLPGMMTMMAVKVMSSAIGKSISGTKNGGGANRGRNTGGRYRGGRNNSHYRPGTHNSTVNRGGNVNHNNSSSNSVGDTNVGTNTNHTATQGSETVHSTPKAHKQNDTVKGGQSSVGAMGTPNERATKASERRTSEVGTRYSRDNQKGAMGGNDTNIGKSQTPARPPLSRDTSGSMNANQKTEVVRNNMNPVTHNEGVKGMPQGSKSSSVINGNIAHHTRGGDINRVGVSNNEISSDVPRRENDMVRKANDIRVRKGNAFEFGNNTNTTQEIKTAEERSEHHGKVNSKYDRSSTERTVGVRENHTENTERVNPEYVKGRRDPAAVNRRAKNSFYQKRTPAERIIRNSQPDTLHKRNRREDNGKPK
ncbi:MAG: hypothetical protein KIG65_01155 [Eubacteriales bacterium]|nr:hypothetical protein [Eubacteriales bacterium]